MNGDISLQSVLNDVAALVTSGAVSAQNSVKSLDEFSAFLALDPLLADLQKNYLDAKSHHAQALREFGRDDPMTDMAQWMEDSTWCAVQTRYMELRGNRSMMGRAQVMIQESLMKCQEREKRERQRDALKTAQQLLLFQKMRQTNEDKNSSLWLLAILLLDRQSMFRFYQPVHAFRLAA